MRWLREWTASLVTGATNRKAARLHREAAHARCAAAPVQSIAACAQRGGSSPRRRGAALQQWCPYPRRVGERFPHPQRDVVAANNNDPPKSDNAAAKSYSDAAKTCSDAAKSRRFAPCWCRSADRSIGRSSVPIKSYAFPRKNFMLVVMRCASAAQRRPEKRRPCRIERQRCSSTGVTLQALRDDDAPLWCSAGAFRRRDAPRWCASGWDAALRRWDVPDFASGISLLSASSFLRHAR